MPLDSPTPEQKKRGKAAGGMESLVQAEKLLQVALVLPSAMFIGWLAGAWADAKWHQTWITIAGVIFGCISGLYYVVRLAIDAEKSAARAEKVDDQSRTGDRDSSK